MNTWKVILATLVIFTTGVITGGLLVHFTESGGDARPGHGASSNRPAQPAGLRMDFLRRMQKELSLTSEQHQRIDKILKEHQEHIKQIIEPLQPDIEEEVQTAKEEFLQELSVEQRARFHELLEQQRAKEQHKGKGPASGATNAPALQPTNAAAR